MAAQKKKTKQRSSGFGKGVALGAALVGAAAAALYYGGDKGKTRRAEVKAWSLKARAEVLEEFEKMKNVSEETYEKAVGKVTKKYAKLQRVGEAEAAKLNRELLKHWKQIEKDYLPPAAKKALKKTAKRPAAKGRARKARRS